MQNRNVPLAAIASAALLVGMLPPTAAADLLPSRQACSAQANPRASEREQERALRCLIKKVRAKAGERRVSSRGALERAAEHKARDVARCGFSHNACGRSADAWAKHFGYDSARSWRWGENLAAGSRHMTARKAVKAWLNSGAHRATLLQRGFEHAGVALRRGGKDYWVLQLGCHGC